MEISKPFLIFLVLMAMTTTITSLASPDTSDDLFDINSGVVSLAQGTSESVLAQNHRHKMTCDKYPRVCAAKGSPGPDCCHKRCVDVTTDRFNCGRCGRWCKYSEICCSGRCLNPLFDSRNCGSCGNKCTDARSCQYGMCNYG